MSKSPQKLFVIIFLGILLSSASYTCMLPGAQASEVSASQKGLNILQEVFGLNLEKYNITTHETNPEFPWLGDTLIEDVTYDLTSAESRLFIDFFFANGNLQNLHVFENQGVTELKQAPNNIASAQTFLNTYQKHFPNPLFGELKVSLNNIDADKNYTKTINDKVLEITVYDHINRTEFKWYYTANGATSPYTKGVALSFTDGYLSSFTDEWDFYPIGTTEVTLSREVAIEIALETAKHHNWTMQIGEAVFDPIRFNPTQSVSWISLNFVGSLEADNPRSENILELYPVWSVGVVFNEVFGELYGAEIDIWADTHEIRSVHEEYSALAADLFKENSDEPIVVVSSSFNVLFVQVAFLGVLMGVAGVFMVVLLRRRQLVGVLQFRRVSVKVFAVFFGLLLFMMVFLPLVETVSASNAGVIWGSRSTGAANSPYSHSWRKTDAEIGKQAYVQNFLSTNCFIPANGYACLPSIWVNKGTIISQAQYLSNTYDSVAVVDFDHGVIGYPGEVIGSTVPQTEPHYMFEDDWGTMVASQSNSASDWNHGVFDVDIYDAFSVGKVHFAFINTCYSANIWHLGQGFSSSGHPLSLPFAFTHRLTEYGTPGSVSTTMNCDGYYYPDSFPQCYIGFPVGSAALDQNLPHDAAGPQWYSWVTCFFDKALNDNVSVKYALDWACDKQWKGTNFGTSVLQTGFHPVWPTFNQINNTFIEEPDPHLSTLAVYGNSNICLKNFASPHVVSVPSIVSAWKSDVGVPLYFNVYSVDSHGHRIRYIFDWGDGTTTITGYSDAGVVVSVPHTWSAQGVYDVKVYASCEGGSSGSWSSISPVVIGDFCWLEFDTATNQPLVNPPVDVWVDGVWVGTTWTYCLVSAGWHTVEFDEDISIWTFVGVSDGYANGASRLISSDTQLTALYFCNGK